MKRRHSTVVLSVNVGASLQQVRDVGEALERVWSVVISLPLKTRFSYFVIALALQNGKSSDYHLLQPNYRVNVGRTCFLAGSIMQGRSS